MISDINFLIKSLCYNFVIDIDNFDRISIFERDEKQQIESKDKNISYVNVNNDFNLDSVQQQA